MARLDKDREAELTPKRMDFALNILKSIGIEPDEVTDKSITFTWKGESVTFWAYSGWFSGKSVTDGRGINNLVKQLRNGI